MLFDIFQNNPIVKFSYLEGLANRQPIVLSENSGKAAVPGAVISCDPPPATLAMETSSTAMQTKCSFASVNLTGYLSHIGKPPPIGCQEV